MDETTTRSDSFCALGIDVGKGTLELALNTTDERLHTKGVRNSRAASRP